MKHFTQTEQHCPSNEGKQHDHATHTGTSGRFDFEAAFDDELELYEFASAQEKEAFLEAVKTQVIRSEYFWTCIYEGISKAGFEVAQTMNLKEAE